MEEEKLNREELEALVVSLQEENKKLAEDRDFWFKERHKIQDKYEAFKNAVKSIVLIID